jgi:hypothetical protein
MIERRECAQKGKIKTPENKEVECKIVRVENGRGHPIKSPSE